MQGLIITDTDIRIATDSDLINATLERLFFLELGTSVGTLTRGSRILDYLDEGADEVAACAILEEASNLIKNFEPRIVLDGIGVDLTPDGGSYGVILYVRWYFADQSQEQTFELIVNKIFVVS
jgi:phage baseplate assembly protein W